MRRRVVLFNICKASYIKVSYFSLLFLFNAYDDYGRAAYSVRPANNFEGLVYQSFVLNYLYTQWIIDLFCEI